MKTIHAVTVPRWGMTMTEGTICSWMAREGDVVALGQELIEIETTKVTNVVEAPANGTLRRIVLEQGITAPVGALAGVIALPDCEEDEIDRFVASYADRMGSTEEQTAVVLPRSIDVDGNKINILESGPETDEVFVLLHGFGGDLTTWLFNQPVFSEHHRTIAIDLPGHGGSAPVASTPAFDAVVSSVARAIDILGPTRIHLVGHSFGGGVAASVAALDPGRVASLSLIAPIGLGEAVNQGFLTEFIAAERRRPMQKVLETLFADPSKITSDMVEGVLRFKRIEGVGSALAAIADDIGRDGRQRQSIGKALTTLDCPILVLWGGKDAILPVPDGSGLPPGTSFHVIADAGHMPQMEAANEVNAAIMKNAGL